MEKEPTKLVRSIRSVTLVKNYSQNRNLIVKCEIYTNFNFYMSLLTFIFRKILSY